MKWIAGAVLVVQIICAEPLGAAIGIPVITNQPASRVAVIGATVTFNVGVSSAPPVSLQWFYNGNALAGETNASLELTNVQTNQRGFYHVLVCNAAAAVPSTPAFLIVYPVAPIQSGGTVRCSSFGGGVNAPATNRTFGYRAAGDQWIAQLFYDDPRTSADDAIDPPTGQPLLTPLFPAPLLKGSFAGYFNDGVRFLPGVTPGSNAVVQVRVWSVGLGDTWEEAVQRWQQGEGGGVGGSGVFTVTTGTGTNDAGSLLGMNPGFFLDPPGGFGARVVATNVTAALGQTVAFRVELSNHPTIRWQKNGLLIPATSLSTTSSTLVITNVGIADAATYHVVLTTTVSPPYTVTVLLNPRLVSPSITPLGAFEALVLGKPGGDIVVEASSDLRSDIWEEVATLSNPTGTVAFSDPVAEPYGRRFYRASVK